MAYRSHFARLFAVPTMIQTGKYGEKAEWIRFHMQERKEWVAIEIEAQCGTIGWSAMMCFWTKVYLNEATGVPTNLVHIRMELLGNAKCLSVANSINYINERETGIWIGLDHQKGQKKEGETHNFDGDTEDLQNGNEIKLAI